MSGQDADGVSAQDACVDLAVVLRQLRAELDWAYRTGLVDETPKATSATQGPTFVVEPSHTHDTSKLGIQNSAGSAHDLVELRQILGDCTRCKLAGLGRKQIVFGVGHPNAELMFIGEGPGADEDRIGEPFVGKAGQLLTKMIESGMGMDRADVYIANIVKCRPPNNRDPEPDEVAACSPFLFEQIRLVQPKVIVTLGRHAAHALLQITTPITQLRGQWHKYAGIDVMPTYHPSYLLRNPEAKRPVWQDIQAVLQKLNRPIPAAKNS